MRIVCIAPYVPGRLVGHAGGAFLYRYLETLAAEHDIVLVAPESPDNLHFLRDSPAGIEVHLVPCRQPSGRLVQRRWWNVRNAVRGLTPGWQVLAGFRRDEETRRLVAGADVVEVQWNQMLTLMDVLPELRRVPVVAVAHDIVAQGFGRRAAAATGPTRPLLRWLAWQASRQERRLLNQTVHVRVLSSKDADLARELGITVPIDVVPPFLAMPTNPPAAGREGDVACIGALWRPENSDGLLWFCREVWPAVRGRCPDATLVLTGADPGPELVALDGRDGVRVEGFQADLAPAYAKAGVFVVPLRQGAGIKVKVLDAMLHRLPVVTTAVGAEGIADRSPPGALVVTDDPVAMATSIVELLASVEARRAMATSAYLWAIEELSPDTVRARALSLYSADGGLRNATPRSS